MSGWRPWFASNAESEYPVQKLTWAVSPARRWRSAAAIAIASLASAVAAVPALAGSVTLGDVAADLAASDAPADGPVTLTSTAAAATPITYNYNPSTGDVTVSLNGNATVVEVDLISAANKFLTAGSKLQTGGLTFVTNSAHEQDGFSNFGSFIPDGFDLGTILPTGLALAQLQTDLIAQYSVSGNSNYVAANVAVPEPTSLAIAGLCGIGLAARRRRSVA